MSGTHLVFTVGTSLYALPTRLVSRCFGLETVHATPGGARELRGLIRERGALLPVIGMRERIGLPTLDQEVTDLLGELAQREQDHRAWLEELERSVQEDRPFALTTDPHACKFGRWYDSYETKNAWVAAELARFEAPHAAIHAVGVRASSLREHKRRDEALDEIAQTRRSVLDQLLRTFAQVRETIRSELHEIGIMVISEAGIAVIAVDAVEAVAPLEPYQGEAAASTAAPRLDIVNSILRWSERPEPILGLDLAQLLRPELFVGRREEAAQP